MILRLAMIGFGNVGQEFSRMLLRKRDWLLRSKGLDIETQAIATKTSGALLSKQPLDLARILQMKERTGKLVGYGPENTALSPLEIIDKTEADLMIELTPLNIETGQPALDHIKAAFEVGLDVVTANKGPIAHAYSELRSLARSRNVRFRFEGTVMDGTPIFSLVERTLPGCEILGIEGVLNSTSNFVLTEMSRGSSMTDAIAKAQSLGFTEADARLDTEGWDAAAKIAALANVLMDAHCSPQMVDRQGISGVTPADIEAAKRESTKHRQVARAQRKNETVELSVKTERVGQGNVFWPVDGTSSAITLKTDLMGDLTILETGPTVTQTAYAILSDVLLVVESIRTGTL